MHDAISKLSNSAIFWTPNPKCLWLQKSTPSSAFAAALDTSSPQASPLDFCASFAAPDLPFLAQSPTSSPASDDLPSASPYPGVLHWFNLLPQFTTYKSKGISKLMCSLSPNFWLNWDYTCGIFSVFVLWKMKMYFFYVLYSMHFNLNVTHNLIFQILIEKVLQNFS